MKTPIRLWPLRLTGRGLDGRAPQIIRPGTKRKLLGLALGILLLSPNYLSQASGANLKQPKNDAEKIFCLNSTGKSSAGTPAFLAIRVAPSKLRENHPPIRCTVEKLTPKFVQERLRDSKFDGKSEILFLSERLTVAGAPIDVGLTVTVFNKEVQPFFERYMRTKFRMCGPPPSQPDEFGITRYPIRGLCSDVADLTQSELWIEGVFESKDAPAAITCFSKVKNKKLNRCKVLFFLNNFEMNVSFDGELIARWAEIVDEAKSYIQSKLVASINEWKCDAKDICDRINRKSH